MIAIVIVTVIVVLAVALIATGGVSRQAPDTLSEREAADRLRPYSGAVECAPQNAPIEREA